MMVNPLAYKYADLNRNLRASHYESEFNALKTAFFQRQQRFPNVAELASLQVAAYESVYGAPVTCGHQLTESEADYYQNRPNLDRLCKSCVKEGRAR